jgi:uncharacterized Tic20 family protein
MDPAVKDVPESMKLSGPSNYILWSYKVKMILLQEGLWHFVEPPTPTVSSSSTVSNPTTRSGAVENPVVPIARTTAPDPRTAPNEEELKYRVGCIITSTLQDSIMLNIVHLIDPLAIWRRLKVMCEVEDTSKKLALKEQLYSLKLAEGKSVAQHLQDINLLVIQLARMEVVTSDLVGKVLNSLPKNWSTFRQIQQGRDRLLLFPKLEGLLLH